MESIIGTWDLESLYMIKNESRFEPFGSDVKGLLTFQSNGYLFGIIAGLDRPETSSPTMVGLADAERIAISRHFNAYAGKYVLDNAKIVQSIEISFLPNLMKQKIHIVSFKCNDDKLILTSSPGSVSDDNMSVILSWNRI